MYLSRLNIINYRNIEELNLSFSKRINCFFGKNGMGKTNILDAIYYLSFCKSHLNAIDNRLIKHNEDFFILQGDYVFPTKTETVYCGVRHKRKKVFKVEDKEYDRLSEHIGRIPLVLVSPADYSLIDEGSDQRRRFIDVVISQYDKDYLRSLIEYNQALQSRNALLKKIGFADRDIFEILEEKMSLTAKPIFEKRTKFTEEYLPVFKNYYQKISSDSEEVGLRYVSCLQNESLKALFDRTREKDKILGFTSQGIHRDDLEMSLDGYQLKRTGSQGQNKSYIVATKFAQLKFLQQINGSKPILLLDDLFDKLDRSRVENIIKIISEDDFGQIFITDTNKDNLYEIVAQTQKEHSFFEIDSGSVVGV